MMAHNVQNVTLALTLPISCHICLGKVRHPVICINHHVFCSSCIDLWLKNNNQCPACRVSITPDNPCKDIIGGTSENESHFSHSVRKHLRKTRFELLHKDYEDEIESLLGEIEELRRTNLTLEERLNSVADPDTKSSSCSCGNEQAEEKSSVCKKLLEEWNRKLEMVNTANQKVTEDIDKLTEENRRLKNENMECVRENLRLKNEVELRSPQKFGRFTVAALQAKVDQYEREMSRLKKALERSDQYIEELEAQIVQLKKPPEDKHVEKSQCGDTALMEEHAGRAATSHVCQDISTAKPFPKHCHDNGIFSDDSIGICPISATSKQTHCKTVSSPEPKNVLYAASWNGEEQTSLEKDTPKKGRVSVSQDLGSPSSSLPFSSLQLNTPDSKTTSFAYSNLKKPLTYLRKLVFDDLPQRREPGKLAHSSTEHNASGTTQPGQPNAVFSNFCHINGNPQSKNCEKTDSGLEIRKQETNPADQMLTRIQTTSGEDLHHPRTSYEHSPDINLLYNNSDPSNVVSHMESQRNHFHSSIPRVSTDWDKYFHSDSLVHICKSSEKTTLSHNESSKQSKLTSVSKPLSSSAAHNEEQAHLSVAQSSTDGYNSDLTNFSHLSVLPCVSLQPEEEVTPLANSKVFLPRHDSEPACLSSPLLQTYSGSPPAKRKLLNSCNNSSSTSSKH